MLAPVGSAFRLSWGRIMSKRVVFKRPAIHHAIIIGYALAPLTSIVFFIVIHNLTLSAVSLNFFEIFGPLGGTLLLTGPVVALGLYFVTRASWYLFLIHGFLSVIDIQIMLFRFPGAFIFSVFLTTVILLGIITYILQKEFRSPYFRTLQRSWREGKRHAIKHVILLNGKPFTVVDLSPVGCYVALPGPALAVGDVADIEFKSENLLISVRGDVMRADDNGYGIRFLDLTRKEREDIKAFLTMRFSLRYQIRLRGVWQFGSQSVEVTVLNISSTGCFMQCDVSNLEKSISGTLIFELDGRAFRLMGKIVWNNESGQYGKPRGYGVRFKRTERRMIHALKKGHKELELVR